MSSRAVVFDTPEGIEYFRLLSMKGRLKLEIKGLRFRIATMPAVNKVLGTRYRSKQKALDHLTLYIEEHYPLTEDPL